jgi:hypothetical protein
LPRVQYRVREIEFPVALGGVVVTADGNVGLTSAQSVEDRPDVARDLNASIDLTIGLPVAWMRLVIVDRLIYIEPKTGTL